MTSTAQINSLTTSQIPALTPATPWNVDPAKQTVAGQMQGLMQSDNPLQVQARTRAKQSANSVGLMNSSMAVQAGEMAAMNAALPIAQADAQTHQSAASQNAKASNDLNLSKLDSDTKLSMSNIEANYKTLMQANASASDVWQQAIKNISELMSNTSLDAANKQAAIDKQIQLTKNNLSFIGQTNNLDLTGLLDFS